MSLFKEKGVTLQLIIMHADTRGPHAQPLPIYHKNTQSMELQTKVTIPKPNFEINHKKQIFMIGSCFTTHIGELLTEDKFSCLVNPFGVLYNPASIAALLLRSISERDYSDASPEFFSDPQSGLTHSWMHHSTFSSSHKETLIQHANSVMHETADKLRQTDILIVTFGTSVIYRLKDSGMLVANCHKQPDRLFVRERLSAYDIADTWQTLIQILKSVNPNLHIVFTVSPIRHKRDGMHVNQLSKAELLLGIDQIVRANDHVYYFPAYELVMDELRDYRFYADDLVHPSSLAVRYIYERFTDTFVSPAEQQLSARCRAVHNLLSHRPTDAESPAYQALLEKTNNLIQDIIKKHPYLDFNAETSLCSTKSKK